MAAGLLRSPLAIAGTLCVLLAHTAHAHAGTLRVPPTAGAQAESAPFELPNETGRWQNLESTRGVADWFAALSARKTGETFGSFVVRAGRLMLGRPYAPSVEVPGQEIIDYNVSAFQCVSFVESSLSIARCAWAEDRTPACFRREVARMRYRHGFVDGFGSRLHYFEDWLNDNAARRTLLMLTDKYAHHTVLRHTAYMSEHERLFPSMRNALERRRVQQVEHRLSNRPVQIVLRSDLKAVEPHLCDGDIVAIATKRPDILIHHAGIIDRDSRGVVHMLHASDVLRKVVRTHNSLSDYLSKGPKRQGVLLSRPLPPALGAEHGLPVPSPAGLPPTIDSKIDPRTGP